MKIQLESKSSTCPDRLTCIACEQKFTVTSLRRLLHDDRSLLHGDLCPQCGQRTAREIQTLVAAHGQKLLFGASDEQEHGKELIAIAQESVKFPSFWQWLGKRIEMLAVETTALEQARYDIKSSTCSCHRLQSLEYMYHESENR